MLQEAELSGQADSENNLRGSSETTVRRLTPGQPICTRPASVSVSSWIMESKRSRLAEAVLRTITALETEHGTDNPQLVEKIRSRVLLRLSDRLATTKPKPKVLLVRAEKL